jgi:hypothetical protein
MRVKIKDGQKPLPDLVIHHATICHVRPVRVTALVYVTGMQVTK